MASETREGNEERRYDFEVFSAEHKPLRERFYCGEEELDEYIRLQANQDMKRGLAVVHVLHDRERERIAAYYTLSSEVVERGALPEDLEKGLGKNRVFPAILIGRLAIDLEYQGRGLGGETLLDALYRALDLSRTSVGAVAVVVDVLHDKAQEFYARYGFERIDILDKTEQKERADAEPSEEFGSSHPKRRLYIPMKSITWL